MLLTEQCGHDLCRKSHQVKCFFYKGTIILGFLVVLLNNKLLLMVGCIVLVLIRFFVSNLEKTETETEIELELELVVR
jgi:hypothetical protein